ncbi:MAG: hypothetical protein COB07_06380 [Sulfurovum sp.]|nr:MAG: hypothetical protein COB07_06380 [Sulfurovum sp.]
MMINKNISDIIGIQNSSKEIIQELYTYESRPDDIVRDSYKSSKLDEAIRFEIIEYDEFTEELSLSADTREYYELRLGQNTQTNLGLVGDKLTKLDKELGFYNQRVKSSEPADREMKAIYNLLSQIPSLLKHNLRAIASNSIFAFKSEANFKIKMEKLKVSKDEIEELMTATYACDQFLLDQHHFFKSMDNYKINSVNLRFKRESIALEKSFIKLFDDIKNFINQSIKDGELIKKLQKLKELKDDKKLLNATNIEEISEKQRVISKSVKVKKLHPDDQIVNYLETLRKIISLREIELQDNRVDSDLKYDVNEVSKVERKLYNYQKLNEDFLSQDEDLMTFLVNKNIDNNRLLGVFIRMFKNYSYNYEVDSDKFVKYDHREYVEVKRCL